MARSNGGIIGVKHHTSFGKDLITSVTSSGNVCTQAGTRFVQVGIVAGGGGAGAGAGGAGAGGLRNIEVPVCGSTAVPVTIGAGGASGPGGGTAGGKGSDSNIVGNDATHTSTRGGQTSGPPSPHCGKGQPGGSGGGGGISAAGLPDSSGAGSGNTPPVDPPQGNNGGQSVLNPNGSGSDDGVIVKFSNKIKS